MPGTPQWIRAGLFAATLPPDVTVAILGAFAALRGEAAGGTDRTGAATLGALEQAYSVGGVESVIAWLFAPTRTEEAMAPVRLALRDALWRSGAWWQDALPRFRITNPPGGTIGGFRTLAGGGGPRDLLRVRFDALNPRAVDAARTLELRTATALTDDAKAGVRAMAADAVERGLNPRQTAKAIREIIGQPASHVQQIASFRRDLETFHLKRNANAWGLGKKISRAPGGAQTFAIDATGAPLDGITERRLRDFRYDGKLARALTTGEPLAAADIDTMVLAYERKLRAFHAVTVARSSTIDALRIGQRLMWEEAIAKGAIARGDLRRFWKTAGDDRVRLAHRQIPRLNPNGVGFDEPFLTPNGTKMHPGDGDWNCRCVEFVRPVVKDAQGQAA